MSAYDAMLLRMKSDDGFIAALDQSGGSTPKALAAYGVTPDAWQDDAGMFDQVHEMRARIVGTPGFDKRVLGAILFEMTMDKQFFGIPAPAYLWTVKGVVPLLKCDKGLAPEVNGCQMMKPIPGLEATMARAKGLGVFGTKMRSYVLQADPVGIANVVKQQFEVAKVIISCGLCPIIEPEVAIGCPDKDLAEQLLQAAILQELNQLDADQLVMLKLTIPTTDNLYMPCIAHKNVVRVVALSGGYPRVEANYRLSKNIGMIASFSRALTEGLVKSMPDDEYNAKMSEAIQSIHDASANFVAMMNRMKSDDGFIAALDQSGGSTPKALAAYGVTPDAWTDDEGMFNLVHDMRSRIVNCPTFHGSKVIAAILFEMTMDKEFNGMPAPFYLWNVKNVVPLLKCDKGLAPEVNGCQMMKPIPGLEATMARAKSLGVFGTKMRSYVLQANKEGIDAVVKQQFEVAKVIISCGLCPIIEPEVAIGCPDKASAEQMLLDAMLVELNKLDADQLVMLKLTIPTVDNLYTPCINHPNVVRVVALSGGYPRVEANAMLAKNIGMIASFSRALTEGLVASMSDEEYDTKLGGSITSIYNASSDYHAMMNRMKSDDGFIAALDQSGGSTPKALAAYGVTPDAWTDDEGMFNQVHEMRARIVGTPGFDKRVLGAILFEMTMDKQFAGISAPAYLWTVKGVVPLLKCDKGLAPEVNGCQMMKPIPGLERTLARAKGLGVFGTKMRSYVLQADPVGIANVIKQQFEVAKVIISCGLCPIIEPEVAIGCPDKDLAEQMLQSAMLQELNLLRPDQLVMLKLTIPTVDNLYTPCINHPNVVRVVALSGGYPRVDANARLAKNKGVIASFSRALTEGLVKSMPDDEYNAKMSEAIESIYQASRA